MNTREMLQKLMLDNYTVDNVIEKHKGSFKNVLMEKLEMTDWKMENFKDPSKQRDLSIKFCWGHNHDFGEFSLPGRMEDRHIDIIAEFIDRFGLPRDLSGMKVLDIGVWTGGTCLLFAALGAEVVALEEVKKYSDTVNYLCAAFGLSSVTCEPLSVYDFDEQDTFDIVIYFGVIYHVTDPVLSLRILFNSLTDGGRIFVETFGTKAAPDAPPYAIVQGPDMTVGDKQNLARGGWNYFIPSISGLRVWMETAGFEGIDLGDVDVNNRIKGSAQRVQHADILRAGLSRSSIR